MIAAKYRIALVLVVIFLCLSAALLSVPNEMLFSDVDIENGQYPSKLKGCVYMLSFGIWIASFFFRIKLVENKKDIYFYLTLNFIPLCLLIFVSIYEILIRDFGMILRSGIVVSVIIVRLLMNYKMLRAKINHLVI